MKSPNSIDIFCAVVDNFGDIGVCWRLARQMASEHQLATRLFVDDMDSFRAIVPEHNIANLNVIPWGKDLSYTDAADIVIEAFACPLPDSVVMAMVKKRSVWIDLEYLTAEDWALGCHAIPSTHPSTGLKKTLFFPGFDARTGGIIREKDLISRRNSFKSDRIAQNLWRKSNNLPEIDEKAIDISFFHYQTAPFDELFNELAASQRPIRIFSPKRISTPNTTQHGSLTLYEIPFLDQYNYDYLLWTCDFNFVRGEDSFVRAQLAATPFIWNIYVQDEDTHLIKLKAFLDKIHPFYDTASAERLAYCHKLWNEGGRNQQMGTGSPWLECLENLDTLKDGARNWSDFLETQTDLSDRLLAFVKNTN